MLTPSQSGTDRNNHSRSKYLDTHSNALLRPGNNYSQKHPPHSTSCRSLPRNYKNRDVTLQTNLDKNASRPSLSPHRLRPRQSCKVKHTRARKSQPANPHSKAKQILTDVTERGLFERTNPHTPRLDQSDVTDSKLMRLLDRDQLAQEIHFRYCHEANKVLFWLRTIRRIFDLLHASQLSKALLVFGCLLLVKAKTHTKSVYNGLLSRRNEYKLARFEEFLESVKFDQTLIKFRELARAASKMETALACEERFVHFIKLYRLEKVLGSHIGDCEYHRVMQGQLSGIIRDKLARCQRDTQNQANVKAKAQTVNRGRDREVFLIIVGVFFSKEIHRLFPYWMRNRKFNWARLDAKLENMTMSTLKQIVSKLEEAL